MDSEDKNNSESNDSEMTPPDVKEEAVKARGNLIPRKTQERYLRAYQTFSTWMEEKNTKKIGESTLLAYFNEGLRSKAPTTMWSEYSLLKKTIYINDNIDISQFKSISELLKQHSRTHSKKKAKTFSTNEIDRYLEDAPNTLDYIQEKFALLLGICGGLRSEEFCHIRFENIVEIEDNLKVTLDFRKTDQAGNGSIFFMISNTDKKKCPIHYYHLYKKEFPKPEGYVFHQIRNGKYTKQKRGKTFFYELPKRVAAFLKLPDIDKYTGHALRRTATTWLAERGASTNIIQKFGGWKSSSVAQEYIDNTDSMRQDIAATIQNQEINLKTTSKNNQLNQMAGITINSDKILNLTINNYKYEKK